MKITKSQLKQIIKEEMQSVLKEYGPMKSKRLYRDAREKIKNLGPALSPSQIQDLANTDRITLAVYDNLIRERHPGILSQNIRQAYEQNADFLPSWEEHIANVQKALGGPGQGAQQ